MPELTSAWAFASTSCSLTRQWNGYQLFQPSGGVRARPLSSAPAAGASASVSTSASSSAPALSGGAARLDVLISIEGRDQALLGDALRPAGELGERRPRL